MRKILTLASLALATVTVSAQSSSAMLYPEYQQGVIYMKGKQKVATLLNYDAGKRCVMYRQNGENMVLVNPQVVDSMKIGKDLFCRIEGNFYEVVSYPCGKLLVDWNLRNVNVGYKGAFGTVSQVRSQSVKLSVINSSYAPYNNVPESRAEIYKVKNNNKYLIVKDDRMLRFSNKKSLLKHFGSKLAEAEAIISKHHPDFTKAEDVMNIIGLLLPLL